MKFCVFKWVISWPQILKLRSQNQIYFFLENYITSEGAISHNVLYYQELPITRYQVKFVNFWLFTNLVSTAFKQPQS